VYNLSFERRVLAELADLFPHHAAGIRSIIDRLVDLMTVFQSRSYYVREMNGRYSIKNVLPAMCAEMSYDGLEIANGDMAMNAFSALQNMTDPREIQKIRENLLKYCKQDTYAMVEIVRQLNLLVSG